MSHKIRTGDIYLANRWSVNGLITHTADSKTRWNQVGIFHVQEHKNGDDVVTVFILTKDGARKVLLDYLLRDASLQSASHRKLKAEYFAKSKNNIPDAMNKLDGEPREKTHILVEEYKGNKPNRNGFNCAELAGKLLEAADLISFKRGMLVSNFQEGGVLDYAYGKETPLFPRYNDTKTEDIIIRISLDETHQIIKDYFNDKHAINVNNYGKYPVKNNNPLNKSYNGVETNTPLQLPTLSKERKRDIGNNSQSNMSDSITRRLKKLDSIKKSQDTWKQSGKFTPINE